MWIAGISICLLAAAGIGAIVRSIPASYANIPNEDAPLKRGAASSGSENERAINQQPLAEARDTINRRNRAQCRTCGVVESMRKIERQGDVGGHHTADIKVAGGVTGGAFGSAIAANAITGKGYEITVRFRDGSTTVLNEASPRTWPLGSRVMVIGRSMASSN
jgi:outer membrane lipoprotein SlyB